MQHVEEQKLFRGRLGTFPEVCAVDFSLCWGLAKFRLNVAAQGLVTGFKREFVIDRTEVKSSNKPCCEAPLGSAQLHPAAVKCLVWA